MSVKASSHGVPWSVGGSVLLGAVLLLQMGNLTLDVCSSASVEALDKIFCVGSTQPHLYL